jgi:hypothetical protein
VNPIPNPKPSSEDVAERGVASIGVRSSGNLQGKEAALPPTLCECLVRGNVLIYRAQKAIQKMIAAHGGGHGRGLPWLAPIRNSSELRGLCCRSCFG